MLTYNVVAGTDLDESGGGLYAEGRSMTLTWVWVVQNSACHGGGMMVSDISSTNVSVTHGSFSENTARCGNGGGFNNAGPAVVSMNDVEMSFNQALSGAGYYDSPGTTLTMNNVEICTNSIDPGGTRAAEMEIFGMPTSLR